jgi:selenocysteine lyase/cysteine desulfurase
MLELQKHLFSLPENIHYLNCAYMSPLLKSVEEAGKQGVSLKNLPYTISTDDFLQPPLEARKLFAQLVNAPDEHSVSLVPSVSYGMAVVAKNLKAQVGQNIVSVSGEFPSCVYAWKEHIQNGVELRLVEPPETWDGTESRAEVWNDRLLAAIDEHTALVVMSSIHWTDGTYFDLEIISDAAHAVGALFVVDGTQSLGAMPFDVQIIKPDALIAGSYKCMMGPYSLGAVYWGEYFLSGLPLEETWIGRAGSEDFRNLVNYRDEYQDGMSRYNVGEQSNFVLVPMLKAALKQLIEWQPERVQAYCQRLVQTFVHQLSDTGFTIEEPHWRANHLFGVKMPHGMNVARLQEECKQRNMFVSLRGDFIRISPSVYNTPDDLTILAEILISVQ